MKALFLLLLTTSLLSAQDRPNILLILCDDLGFSDLGCYGGEIETPNLDKLAAEGTRFSQFYNCAVCVTTRSALLTGLHPRHGSEPRLRTNMVTLGEAMKEAGYATALTGKWHLGSVSPLRPIDRGFDEFYGLLSGCSNFFNPAKQDPIFYNGGNYRPFAHNEERITEFPEDFHTTDAFSDHAVKTIQRFSSSEDPFFIHLCYTAPHFPLHARPEDIERYRGKYAAGYDALREQRQAKQVELGIFEEQPELSPVDEKTGDFRYDYSVPIWEELDKTERKLEENRMEVYAAMVHQMDQGIGKVLQALEDSNVAQNTVVFFLSDNGGCASWPVKNYEGFVEYNKGLNSI
ncbi:MAG: arylsulfatase A-like enzyme, partial [Verrucomicrobiales bacterium]